MSEIAIGSVPSSESAFNRKTMLWITAVGVLAFIAMLVLGAYAPDLRSGKNGGAHALSNASVGFSGLVKLADATGRNPYIVRSLDELESEDLAVVTPEDAGTDLTKFLQRRGQRLTLIVLPKWMTSRDPVKPGWVEVDGLIYKGAPEGVLAPDWQLKVERHKRAGLEPLLTVPEGAPKDLQFLAPAVMQTISGDKLEAVITDQQGRVVLGKYAERPLYVLADPDLLNNHGMADEHQAAAAMALLDYLNSTDSTGIMFDVTANGFGRSRSPLKLAFDPPFLAVTLTIFIAMLLAAIQAAIRFGSPSRPERAIAFGKAALVDNSAGLIRKAGREANLGPRYVDVIRDRAAALFRLPPTLSPEALDQRLEAMNPRRSFAELANLTEAARSRDELLTRSQSLHQWVEEVQE